MKKKIAVIAIILIVIISSVIAYRHYTGSQVKMYLNSLTQMSKSTIFSSRGLTGNIKLERIVKESPKELIMIVKWGDDEVYISIENWLTRAHDKMQICPFDKKKSMLFYE